MYRFVFLVEMEMTIWDFVISCSPHHKIIKKSQIEIMCRENCFWALSDDFLLRNFNDVWKSVVIGYITPPSIASSLAYFRFSFFLHF